MNISAARPYKLTVSHLGPIFELSATLSDNQNKRLNRIMIFARNGTGKSFLARAFRAFEDTLSEDQKQSLAQDLVPDEAPSGIGEFTFETEDSAKLTLDRTKGEVKAVPRTRLFHVFTEDFVDQELRQRRYLPDGNIEGDVLGIDAGQNAIVDAQKALDDLQDEHDALRETLEQTFDTEKEKTLVTGAGINRALGDYKRLSLPAAWPTEREKPEAPSPSLAGRIAELKKLLSLPENPDLPEEVLAPSPYDVSALTETLARVTSPSAVADEVKQKIMAHTEFFKSGVALLDQHQADICPFCEQDITGPTAAEVIDSYVRYFNDAETRHREELSSHNAALAREIQQIEPLEKSLKSQRDRFDLLKGYVPSQKDIDLETCEAEVARIRSSLKTYIDLIAEKQRDLAAVISADAQPYLEAQRVLAETIERNARKASALASAITKINDERLKLQRMACAQFATEFVIENWTPITRIFEKRLEIKDQKQILSDLRRTGLSGRKRDRVAGTFTRLLKMVFGDKYTFDEDRFELRRKETASSRETHKTLSDGEKSVIAFCYFIASIHRRVETAEDYKRLFLVIDDPVTSMSFDYVFSIVQILRYLCISQTGDISWEVGQQDKTDYKRSEFLILTHSDYFFNLLNLNHVVEVKQNAALTLGQQNNRHTLLPVGKLLAPFHMQLRHVWEVTQGREPDFSTGNCVRAIIENIGRFCIPDRKDLRGYISHFTGVDGIPIKSVLINSMSHSLPGTGSPDPEEMRQACRDVLAIVEKYAPGQLKQLGTP